MLKRHLGRAVWIPALALIFGACASTAPRTTGVGTASAAPADYAPVSPDERPSHLFEAPDDDMDRGGMTYPGPNEGNWEFTLGAQGSNDENFDVGSGSLDTSIGYFFGPATEVALRQTVVFADFGDSVWNGSTRIALDFHFPTGNFRPFVGLNFGWVYGDTVNETMEGAPEAGVKYYVQDAAFLYGMAEYQFFFDDAGGVDEGFENGQFVYSIGIGLMF